VPDEPGDTRRRLDVVEQRLDAVETKINSEAGLRAMMDLDQATLTARLDAQDYLLRALSVTQSEHGAQLRKLTDHQVRLADNQAAMADEQTRLADHQAAMADEQTRQATNQAAIADEQTRMAGEQQRTTSALGRVEAGVRTIIGLLDRDG